MYSYYYTKIIIKLKKNFILSEKTNYIFVISAKKTNLENMYETQTSKIMLTSVI